MGLGEKEVPCKKGISSRVGKKWELIRSTGDYRQIGKKKEGLNLGLQVMKKLRWEKNSEVVKVQQKKFKFILLVLD